MNPKPSRLFLSRAGHLLVCAVLAFSVTGSAFAQATLEGEHWGTAGIAHPNSCYAYGWALDPADETRAVQVRVLADGVEVARGETFPVWFAFNLWGLISNYEPHQITAQAYDVAAGQWIELAYTPLTLTCVNYDLYLVNVKTGVVERLTTLADTGEYNPSWAPDSHRLVHDVTDAYSQSLFITDVKTHVSVPLAGSDGGNDPAWSPNGQWIVFDRRWYNDLNLYRLPPTGGVPQLVVSNAANAAWSPNSQRLVFERDGGLWTASVSGGDEQLIAAAGINPAWSPNGQWIAYELGGDLWKVRVNAHGVRQGDPLQVTNTPATESGPSWSQNSQRLAFMADIGGDFDIWQIAAEGGVPVPVAGNSLYGDYDEAYSNNGQYIAYSGALAPTQP